jgi:mRNA-degrading endonuclease RelE of RelBE toxin-antitoxin system
MSCHKMKAELAGGPADTAIDHYHLTFTSTPCRIPTMATVKLTPAAADGLERLNNPIHGRVLKLLVRLERWPDVSGAEPLGGELAGRYRLRTGDYRIQFHVAGDVVTVEKIAHRDGFYGG